jgi:hypothetical protein
VEDALVGGAVAEEGDRDGVAAQVLVGPRRADGDRDAAADDAVRAEDPEAEVHGVHGAALAAAEAVDLAEELGHHRVDVGALGQQVAVAAVGGGDAVVLAQGLADADRGALLADVEVDEARQAGRA